LFPCHITHSYANSDSVPLSSIGTIVTPSLSLYDVYYIPSLAMNLVFVGKCCDSGYNVYLSSSERFVQDRTSQKVIKIGCKQGELYVLNQFKESIVATSSVDLSSFNFTSSSPFYLWYSSCLGHVSASCLKVLVSTGILGTLESHDMFDCSGYKLAKFFALPFNENISSSLAHFDLVLSDV